MVTSLRGNTKLSKNLEVIFERGKLDLYSLLIALELFNFNSVELSTLEIVHSTSDSNTLNHRISLLSFVWVQSKETDHFTFSIYSFHICN